MPRRMPPTRPTFPTTPASRCSTTTWRRQLQPGQPVRRGGLDQRGEHALQGGHRLPGPDRPSASTTPSCATPAASRAASRTWPPARRGGHAVDTNNNAVDFFFVDTNGTSAGAGQRLGASGARRTSRARCSRTRPSRSGCSTPGDGGEQAAEPGARLHQRARPQLHLRHDLAAAQRSRTTRAATITRLRFRVVDLTTFPAPSGFADLRPRTSAR